jgi:S1-C subfamily serine protease
MDNPNPTGPATEHHATPEDIGKLLGGEGGVDLAAVTKDGKPSGMRVFGVRAGSTAARLGAQNGDILESVNDVSAASPGSMSQWSQLATRDRRLVIKGTRAGQPFTTVLVIDGR